MGSITSRAVLSHFPTPAILLASDEYELVEVIATASKSGYKFAKKKAEALIKTAETAKVLGIHTCADESMILSIIPVLNTLSDSVTYLEQSIGNLLAQVKTVRKNVELLQTIPGVGPHSASLIMAEIGDILLFKSQNSSPLTLDWTLLKGNLVHFEGQRTNCQREALHMRGCFAYGSS